MLLGFKPGIPLLFRHERPARRILELKLTPEGLRVKAHVTDREAATCRYFSVGASVLSYHLNHIDDADAWHAAITSAVLDEVSLTHDPSNPSARVEFCCAPSPALASFDIAIQGIQKGLEIVALLRQQLNARAKPVVVVDVDDADIATPDRELAVLGNTPQDELGVDGNTPINKRPSMFRELVEAIQKQEGDDATLHA